jgi:hypothetical protein
MGRKLIVLRYAYAKNTKNILYFVYEDDGPS